MFQEKNKTASLFDNLEEMTALKVLPCFVNETLFVF